MIRRNPSLPSSPELFDMLLAAAPSVHPGLSMWMISHRHEIERMLYLRLAAIADIDPKDVENSLNDVKRRIDGGDVAGAAEALRQALRAYETAGNRWDPRTKTWIDERIDYAKAIVEAHSYPSLMLAEGFLSQRKDYGAQAVMDAFAKRRDFDAVSAVQDVIAKNARQRELAYSLRILREKGYTNFDGMTWTVRPRRWTAAMNRPDDFLIDVDYVIPPTGKQRKERKTHGYLPEVFPTEEAATEHLAALLTRIAEGELQGWQVQRTLLEEAPSLSAQAFASAPPPVPTPRPSHLQLVRGAPEPPPPEPPPLQDMPARTTYISDQGGGLYQIIDQGTPVQQVRGEREAVSAFQKRFPRTDAWVFSGGEFRPPRSVLQIVDEESRGPGVVPFDPGAAKRIHARKAADAGDYRPLTRLYSRQQFIPWMERHALTGDEAERMLDQADAMARYSTTEQVATSLGWPQGLPPRRGAPAGETPETRAVKELAKNGLYVGQAYAVRAHTDNSDSYHQARFIKIVSVRPDGRVVVDTRFAVSPDVRQTIYDARNLLWMPAQAVGTEIPPYAGLKSLPDVVKDVTGDDSRALANENKALKALLTHLAPGVKWSVKGGGGTAWGWSDVRATKGNLAEALAAQNATKTLGISGNPLSGTPADRYHILVPAELVDVVRAALADGKAAKAPPKALPSERPAYLPPHGNVTAMNASSLADELKRSRDGILRQVDPTHVEHIRRVIKAGWLESTGEKVGRGLAWRLTPAGRAGLEGYGLLPEGV